MIRPVRPTAPPPPPTPPRRRESLPPAIEDAGEYGVPSYAEPPTMAAARERLHALARELPRDHAPQFEEATRARIDGAIARYSPHHRDAHSYDQQEPEQESYEQEESFEDDEPIEAETSLRNEAYTGNDAPNSYYPSNDRYQDEQEEAEDDAPYSEAPAPKYSRGGPPGVTDSGPRERPAPASVPYDNEAYETSYPGVDRRGIVRHEPSRDERRDERASRDERRDSYRSLDERLDRNDDSQSRRREQPRAEHAAPPSVAPQAQPTRREDSGARHVEMPTEMKVPANFVVGVQPIRQPVAIAPVPAADAMALPAPAGTMAASPRAMQAGQQQPVVAQAAQAQLQSQMAAQMAGQMQGQLAAQMAPQAIPSMPAMPMPTPAMPMMPGQRVPTTRPPFGATPRNPTSPQVPAGTVGHQLQTTAVEEAAQGSKVGRFAWFVFGAAFGIFFAFFATGFVPRLGKKEEIVFPPTAQQAATATQATAQPVAPQQPGTMGGATAAPTYVQQGVVPAPGQPAMTGTVATTVPGQPAFPQTAPTMTAPAYAAQPTAAPMMTAAPTAQAPQAPSAPQPAFAAAPTTTAQRAQAPRPRFQPVRGPRRSTPKSDKSGDDDAPPKSSGGDSSDLLNAGLGN